MSPPPDGVNALFRWSCGTATRTYSLYRAGLSSRHTYQVNPVPFEQHEHKRLNKQCNHSIKYKVYKSIQLIVWCFNTSLSLAGLLILCQNGASYNSPPIIPTITSSSSVTQSTGTPVTVEQIKMFSVILQTGPSKRKWKKKSCFQNRWLSQKLIDNSHQPC